MYPGHDLQENYSERTLQVVIVHILRTRIETYRSCSDPRCGFETLCTYLHAIECEPPERGA